MIQRNYIFGFIVFLTATFITFGKSIHYDFLYWDDIAFIVDNDFIRNINLSNLWTMCKPHFGIVTPVYWLSLAMDYQIFGTSPAGYRMENMVLHALNILLAFYLFRTVVDSKKYKDLSVFIIGILVVLIWGLHPLRVESVVWLSQRRDVLCAFFELLCIIFYLKASADGAPKAVISRYRFCSIISFLLAILTKPTAVPLPIALVLLDCYPLKLINTDSAFASQILKSAWDKKSYFLVSAISAVLTIYGHKIYQGLAPIEMFSLEHRFGNAIFGITFYIIQSIVPINLLPFYPRQSLSIGNPLLLSTIVLYLVIAVTLIKISRKHKTLWPLVVVGIYLAMLLPVLGIFQGGNQGAGDRFTYMSTIPFFFLLGILLLKNISRLWIWGCLGAWSILLLVKTINQQEIWQSDETFYRTLTTKTAYQVATAYNKLGLILMDKNAVDDAMAQFESALKCPGAPHELAGAANCIGNIYFTRNQFDQAEKYYNMAVNYDASTFLAHNNLGNINTLKGNAEAALASYKKAIEITPNYSAAYYNLAKLYSSLNLPSEAEATYKKAVKIDASLKTEK